MRNLDKTQKALYNAMNILNSAGCTVSDAKAGGRPEIIFAVDFWDVAGDLALRLLRKSEVDAARKELATMQMANTKAQAKLQDKINLLIIGVPK